MALLTWTGRDGIVRAWRSLLSVGLCVRAPARSPAGRVALGAEGEETCPSSKQTLIHPCPPGLGHALLSVVQGNPGSWASRKQLGKGDRRRVASKSHRPVSRDTGPCQGVLCRSRGGVLGSHAGLGRECDRLGPVGASGPGGTGR